MEDVYISFGSNIGDRCAHIHKALDLLLAADGLTLIQLSSIYETEPVGFKDQRWFLNGVVSVESYLLAHPLLSLLKVVENQVGREPRPRWGPREIDLDLLLLGDQCIDTPELTVPHPEMHRRRFVLQPFVEIAPNVVHPILGKKIHTLLSELTESEVVRGVTPPLF